MGFDSLSTALTEVQLPLTARDVAFEGESLEDVAALSVVLQDTASAEAYLSGKNLISNLDAADNLYRAYVKPKNWPGTDTPRSNLGMPVVMEAIERIMPALFMPLFQNSVPFFLEPLGNTTAAAARAKTHLLSWAIKQAGFKEEIRRALKTCLQYGFVVGNVGWESKTKKVKKYVREDGKIKRVAKTITINQPSFECSDLRKILIDPACDTHNVRKSAKFIVKQIFVTANDLDDLRDDPTYKNIPTREELREILSAGSEVTEDSLSASKTNNYHEFQAEVATKNTTLDPLQQPLEILEYSSKDRIIAVLQRKIVIRNDENEDGELPYVSCAFIDILGSAWGFGVAKLLSGEQRFQQAVLNSWVDSLALVLNPAYQLLKGLTPGAQQVKVSPGKVITETGELKPLAVPSVSTEAMNAIGTSEERANRRVAANGGSAMPNQAMRTAEGIQSFTGDVIQRLQYFLDIFVEMIFVPVLESFLETCADNLTPEEINGILSDSEAKTYQGDILDVYNAKCSVNILAGTKLMAKVAAGQLLPQLIQLVSAAPVQSSLTQQGKKFDYAEMIEQACDLMGWDVNSLIVDMTPDDLQRAQQMNAPAVKAQADAALEQQKQQNALEQIDAKAMAQTGSSIVKTIVKKHAEDDSNTADLESLAAPMMQGGMNGQSATS